MANEMIKFYKGALGSLPTTGVNGAIYITTDEGGIYLGTGEGMKRLGDFIQVASVSNLPTDGANASALYYCVQENILAKYDSAKGWQQINKQPTAEEMKTLLGLGTMAYKSEVAEADLTAALQEKINTVAEGNHAHTNKDELDLIAAGDVAKWNAAEGNAKTYADGLDAAMNTRVEALEAIDHDHANKALLDTYTQTEADLADAVAKKHAHTFNETELNKIVEGDVAKWNGVAADHLTSADKTTLENAIKEAKKAGTDANTALEAYKVTNDAAIDAIEEDIAEITDGTNGILAQAKSYSDGKLATARTEISAEIDADVKVVADDLAGYKTSNDAALAGVKATAEAAATKTYVDTELDKKVAKTDYEADKATFATKTELGDVDKKFASYRTAADQDTIDNGHKERIEALEAKFTGDNSVDAKIAAAVKAEEDARKEAVKGVQDEVDAVEGRMDTAEGKIATLEEASAKHATQDALNAVDAKFANYKTAEAQKAIDDAQDARIKAIEDDYVVADDIANFATKTDVQEVATDLAEYVEANDKALADVKATAEAATTVDEVNTQIDTKIEALKLAETYETKGAEDRAKAYVDGKFTEANLDQYTTEQEVKDIVDGVIAGAADSETYNSLTKLVDYIDTHGGEATAMAQAIDTLEGDVKGLKEAPSAGIKASDIEAWNGEIGAKALAETKTTAAEVKDQIEAYGYATTEALGKEQTRAEAKEAELAEAIEAAKADAANKDAVVLAEAQAYADQAEADAKTYADGIKTALQAEIDADVKALADGAVAANATNIANILDQLQWGSF
jgi:hypothetical protein